MTTAKPLARRYFTRSTRPLSDIALHGLLGEQATENTVLRLQPCTSMRYKMRLRL
jgi:hypothetical protein